MSFARLAPALLALLVALLPLPAGAQEAILDYHSDIAVARDGTLEVAETLRVRAEGQQIKRGIYRDFPTRYRNRWGGTVQVPFQVISVTRDGKPERWHTESRENGVRIYVGDKERMLEPGEYTYAITYRTARQLGFFADHDELYWNVTGNDWAFPILQASARVSLPQGLPADALKLEAYTGPTGARGTDYRSGVADGLPWFVTTAPLNPGEGLTIVVSFPKGLVAEPSADERRRHFMEDNRGALVTLAGIGLLLAYYLVVWRAFGKDPEGGTVIPLFEPPKGVSPAAARYLARMDFDNKAFAAAVIDMAVKGYLRIEEASRGAWQLVLGEKSEDAILFPEERHIAECLRLRRAQPLELEQSNRGKIATALDSLKADLKKQHFKVNFVTNSRYTIPGLLISLIVQVASALAGGGEMAVGAVFMMIWLTGWTFGVAMLLRQTVAAWRAVPHSLLNVVPALVITAFSVPFVAGEFFGLFMFWQFGGPLAVATLLVLVAINWSFYEWLKAPTLAGRRLYDQIAGFTMYLGVAEQDRLQLLHPPERTPQLFEKYLPYALALDVENEWAEQFAEVFAMQERTGRAYAPGWYSGSRWDGLSGGAFASALGGSLAGAVASSSTAPGSSSGSSGGGSSGGGGGGGGGGGW